MAGSQEQSESLRPGTSIGHGLRIEALLGQGGTAAVYRVKEERSGKKLALKWLRPPNDERRALVTSQFEREYHTLAQLAHPRIIEVYDYGVEQGAPYYTMELLGGEDLRERGKLPWRQACALLCDVASSLAILHARGLVHRDVSARNVRCTADGRAKLIDFGAMVPMAGSHRAIGTPPFVPPEALQLQALDGRADLYGLGALAYWTLTGHHAYPAKTLHQLRDAWRSAPRNPRDYAPDLPEALAELLMVLLRLERSERPRTAAEVMERLSGIAGLSLAELPQVSRSYLITPTLVGRDAALQQARTALLEAKQGAHGAALMIHGPPGIGRSRCLDACVLEAKLLGATVLRASRADSGNEDYGVVRVLCSQLWSALPGLAEQNARPRLLQLAFVLPELRPHAPASRTQPERRHLQVALRDWLLATARVANLVIAVDDVSAIDEPSAALLGTLAHGAARRRLTLLLTARADVPPSPALQLLNELSRSVVLEPLQPPQTEALLRSLFGDAERLSALAERIHGASQGVPRRILALAEHLVARGSARYEAGSWALPLELTAADLPESEREAISAALAALGPDARALAETLSLTDPSALSLPEYTGLCEHDDPGRSFAAIEELRSAGLLLAEGDRYRTVQNDALAPLAANLDPATRRRLHARLAQAVRSSGRSALRQLHMLRGGLEREAIDELLASAADVVVAGQLDVLACAADAAERCSLPIRTQLALQHRLVRLSAIMGNRPRFMRHAWPLVERLERDSGVHDYYEMDPTLDGPARVAQAFARAEQRFQDASESDRGFSVRDSLTMLVTLQSSCGIMAVLSQDISVVERLHSLAPWKGLSLLIELLQQTVDAQRAMLSGKQDVAHDRCLAILTALDAPAARESMRLTRLGNVYFIGLLKAARGQASCLERIAELDAQPGYRGNAWRVRLIHALALGDLEHARECRRRAELLDVQDSGGLAHPGSSARAESLMVARIDDLLGLKRGIERIQAMAAAYPRWQPTLSLARSDYKRVQGDLEGALAALRPALADAAPGQHLDWGFVADAHVLLLHELGRDAEAHEHAVSYLAEGERHGLRVDSIMLKRTAAEALVGLGRLPEARRLSDEHLAGMRELGIVGAWLGMGHETRARVALAQRDRAELREHAEQCAHHYRVGKNPGLTAKYERLLREASLAGMPLLTDTQRPLEAGATPADDAERTVYSRMLSCISANERAERALQLMLEATGAQAGYLFGLRSGKLEAIASTEPAGAPAGLQSMLDDVLQRQFEAEASHSVRAASREERLPPMERFIDELAREFELLLLSGEHHGEPMIAGIAALHHSDDERPALRWPMVDAVVNVLIAGDIVDAVTCVA
jgi:hypothetical protein